jgi:hypothetical protein
MRGQGSSTGGRHARLRALVLALAVLGGTPATAGATSSASQIKALNAQREANGIPAGIVEVPGWSEGCRRHMAYIAANGGVLTHEESPSNPGYSAEGAEIGWRAVLTPLADAFNAAGNAFEFAPLHLMQTLSPALSRMGVWGGCATTMAGYDRKPARPALYTYPGDGATGVYESERAYEMPFVPGDFVGLPQGTTTGPHIYLLPHGAGPGQIASASVTGPSGPIEIRSVDNTTKGLEGYMPPGGIVIPVAPLAPGTTYAVSATFQPNAGAALSRTWSFETAAAATSGSSVTAPSSTTITGVALRLDNPRAAGRSVTFRLLAGQSLVGRRATITMFRVVRSCAGGTCRDRQRGRRLRSVIGRLAAIQTITAPRPAARRAIKIVVQTQPFESGGLTYAAGLAVGRWGAR